MHECSTCGIACDCDGEDTWLMEPLDHVCIGECWRDDEDDYCNEDAD